MFRFEHTEYLWFLLGLIPLALLLWVTWKWYAKQRRRLGDVALVRTLTQHYSVRRRKGLQMLTLIVSALLIVAWANPQWGSKRQKVNAKSADVFIALDISNSMYCQDIAPSRLDQAKRFASQLCNRLRGERVGLILFAGNAYLQMPLTSDYAAAQVFVQSAHPGLAGTQGTALGDAIETALEGFDEGRQYHRVLVIVTDGEDHDAGALALAKEAYDQGMLIFTVGVGTADGSFIPMIVRGEEDWKRDAQGQPVRTKLNETLLNELADQGGGQYFHLSEAQTIIRVIDEKVDQLEKREFEEKSFTEYESYFQLFLGLGILGIILQWLLKNNLLNVIRD